MPIRQDMPRHETLSAELGVELFLYTNDELYASACTRMPGCPCTPRPVRRDAKSLATGCSVSLYAK